MCCQIDEKVEKTKFYANAWREGQLLLDQTNPVVSIPQAGQPDNLELVEPKFVPKRKLQSTKGLAALLHAVAHIEFNAINLAWDAVYRFRDMPSEFYSNWIQVADEEALHFSMIREPLQAMGYDYGELPAHNGLWEMAVETEADVMVRMALVPRVLEARGLDATPKIMQKLQKLNQTELVDILKVILRDEVGHVAIGTRWFNELCAQRNLEPEQTFRDLLNLYYRGKIKGPFNIEARLKAGFSLDELDALESL
ncbi:ferritin-like domain-containing protein [Candidatus Albibeggiatoa sp. nov. NOAA]|uniref:ferritin-like domain-containing protein n=1 Tax=Candidatus Albibeggiatoa sp. nov. NOAA TaxID=3162724 RepID=UPI0032FD27B5|nr:ferritin-like domain-containing protein [Thiotrichaceae bacterium]